MRSDGYAGPGYDKASYDKASPGLSRVGTPKLSGGGKPAYDDSALLLPGKFRRRFSGNLPEGMGKRRHAGIA
jgi:hypothetical protein